METRANPITEDPFEYVLGPKYKDILKLGKEHGITFIADVENPAVFSERPIFGRRNLLTKNIRTAQRYAMLGPNVVSPREAMGRKFKGLTVSLSGSGGYTSGLELNEIPELRRFGRVGIEKRAIVDYLGEFEAHPLFKWAKEKTVGYSNWKDVFGKTGGIARWEQQHGQKISEAVFKLNVGAQSEAVWIGLDKLPSSMRGREDLIIQPRLKILEEYRVVHAGNKAVDITYRWGKGAHGKAPGKLSPLIKAAGIPSGKPELFQPVFGKEAKLLKAFAEPYSQTLSYKVGALDIARVGPGPKDFIVIEAQKRAGNLSLPWVRQKIEYALTGKWPVEWKAGAALLLAAVGAGIVINHFNDKDKKPGSNNKPYNKILGHHSGWANKQTEAAIDSDFTAGKSLAGKKNAFDLFRVSAEKIIDKAVKSKGVRSLAKELGAERISTKKLSQMIEALEKVKKSSLLGRGFSPIEKNQLRMTLGSAFSVPKDALERAAKMGDTVTAHLIKEGFLKPGTEYYGSLSNLSKTPLVNRWAKLGIFPRKMIKKDMQGIQKFLMVHESLEKSFLENYPKSIGKYASHFSVEVPNMEAFYLGRSGNISLYHRMIGIRTKEALINLSGALESIGSKKTTPIEMFEHLSTYARNFKRGSFEPGANIPTYKRMFYSPWVQIGAPVVGKLALDKKTKDTQGDREKSESQNNLVSSVKKKIINQRTAGLANGVLHDGKTKHQIIDVHEKTKHLFRV